MHGRSGRLRGGRETDRTTDAERALKQPGEAADHRWQDAPVEQESGEHAHDKRHGQCLKGKDELAPGSLQFKRERATAQVAKDERCSSPRGRGNRIDHVVDKREGCPDWRYFQQENDENDGEAEPKPNCAPRDGTAALTQQPCTAQKRNDADHRSEIVDEHQARSPVFALVLRPAKHLANAVGSGEAPAIWKVRLCLSLARSRAVQEATEEYCRRNPS